MPANTTEAMETVVKPPTSILGSSTLETAAFSSEDALKIHWYEEKAPAPTGDYTIVISCAANAYGDYMTGYSEACLYVDDFEWVY